MSLGVPSDAEFRAFTISEVLPVRADYFELLCADGTHFGVANPKQRPLPQPTQRVRTYGCGVGYPIRGVAVERGYTYYYRTREEDEKTPVGARFAQEGALLPPRPPPAADDAANHPKHYNMGGIEVIDVIEAWGLEFCLGNAVKYIARAGYKDRSTGLEDLKKARWYLDREISKLEGRGT